MSDTAEEVTILEPKIVGGQPATQANTRHQVIFICNLHAKKIEFQTIINRSQCERLHTKIQLAEACDVVAL